MQHRNLNSQEWTAMAIDSLYTWGELKDWKQFSTALASDVKIAQNALRMAEGHEDPGSAALARILVKRFHPELLEHAPQFRHSPASRGGI